MKVPDLGHLTFSPNFTGVNKRNLYKFLISNKIYATPHTMKPFTYLTTFLAFALLLGLTSCDDGEFCKDGKGSIHVSNVDVPAFSGAHLKVGANVFISQGEEQAVRIEAQRNVMEELDIAVVNGILVIDLDRCFFSYDMDVYITLAQPLTSLDISGSGDIIGDGQLLAAEDAFLGISGSGDMRLNVDAVHLESHISGSGNINVSGITDTHEILISGSGDVRAFDLQSTDTDVRISGSGRADVFIVDGGTLDVRISGSGDVRYLGNPEQINTQISGSGNLINAN